MLIRRSNTKVEAGEAGGGEGRKRGKGTDQPMKPACADPDQGRLGGGGVVSSVGNPLRKGSGSQIKKHSEEKKEVVVGGLGGGIGCE